jgi:integrase
MESVLLDAAGHRRSPATLPGHHQGRPPRNKGEQYPADPPTVDEIVAVMRTIGGHADGHRLRALIVLLWRAGLRISEALALQESDLDRGRGAVLIRRGKGGKRREVGMDRWAWEQLDPSGRWHGRRGVGAIPAELASHGQSGEGSRQRRSALAEFRRDRAPVGVPAWTSNVIAVSEPYRSVNAWMTRSPRRPRASASR